MIKETDTKWIGNLTELQVATYATSKGIQVSMPFGDRARYDQIWDIDGILLKIQVKTASPINESVDGIKFSSKSCHRVKGHHYNTRYTKDEIDFFATFWDNQCYLVPVEETSRMKTLRFTLPKNFQVEGINYAEGYTLENMIKRIKHSRNNQ